MPVYRGPDGRIIEERTRRAPSGRPGSPDNSDQGKTARTAKTAATKVDEPSGVGAGGPDDRYDAKTMKIDDLGGAEFDVGDDAKTRVMTRSKRGETEKPDEYEPVVGWLVICDGCGKGRSFELGHGMNSIGRGSDQSVSLDFGDDLISRQNHAMVTYDLRGRRFFVQHGGGKNLTYLQEEPVLAPTDLPNLATIQIGRTSLKFVALCGADFHWQSTED